MKRLIDQLLKCKNGDANLERLKLKIPISKSQIPNKFQSPIPKWPKWFCFEFEILVIEIYLEFGVCDLVI
jgi:hypothetical protein